MKPHYPKNKTNVGHALQLTFYIKDCNNTCLIYPSDIQQVAIYAVLRSKTARFRLQNVPFCIAICRIREIKKIAAAFSCAFANKDRLRIFILTTIDHQRHKRHIPTAAQVDSHLSIDIVGHVSDKGSCQ